MELFFMVIDEIRFYQLLQAKIGKTEAEALVHIIDQKVNTKFEQRKDELATKEDVSNLRAATKEDISNLRAATKDDISNLRAATKEDISNLRAELLRTIYLTSLGQLVAIIASVISLILVMKK